MKKIIIKNFGLYEEIKDYVHGTRNMIIEGRDDMEIIVENIDV